jgi:hypothetical protein
VIYLLEASGRISRSGAIERGPTGMGITQGLGLGPPPPDDDHRQNVLDRWIWGRFGWSFVALVITVVFFIFDWGGYRGKFAPWGDPSRGGHLATHHFPKT